MPESDSTAIVPESFSLPIDVAEQYKYIVASREMNKRYPELICECRTFANGLVLRTVGNEIAINSLLANNYDALVDGINSYGIGYADLAISYGDEFIKTISKYPAYSKEIINTMSSYPQYYDDIIRIVNTYGDHGIKAFENGITPEAIIELEEYGITPNYYNKNYRVTSIEKVQEIIKKNKYIHSKFSDEDIKGLINAVLEEETRLRKNFNPKSEGCFSPAVAGVLYKTPDGKSEYFFGINSNSTAYPGNINSTLLKRIIYMPDNIENSYKNSTGKGSHAEIFAICDAMDKYKNADKDDFLIYVNASKYTRETTFDPFCTCPHCEYILKDFNIISNTERIEY